MIERELRAETATYLELKRRLQENTDADLTDTLEGETNLHELIAATLRQSIEKAAMVKALDGMIETLSERQSRLEVRRLQLRSLAMWAMNECGLDKLAVPDFTVSVRPGKPKMVIDEAMVDVRFMKQVTTVKPDRDALEAEVKAGRTPYGIRMTNAESVLTLRQK